MGAKLTKADLTELIRLRDNPRYGSSDRTRDRARARLKRLDLVRFNRTAWEWEVLPAGRRALAERGGE